MEEIEIVTLAPDKWEDYRNLRLRALKEEPQAYETKYTDALNEPLENWKMRLEQAEEGKTEWISFAKSNTELIGMAVGFSEPENKVATIVGVFIAEEVRGRGISKKLMDHLILNIQKSGHIKELRLEVTLEQTVAFNLYKSLGFEEYGRTTRALGNGEKHDIILMKRKI